jgi:hypothetical protein
METLKFKLSQFAQNPAAAIAALLVAIITPIQETIVDVGVWLLESAQSLISLFFELFGAILLAPFKALNWLKDNSVESSSEYIYPDSQSHFDDMR